MRFVAVSTVMWSIR